MPITGRLSCSANSLSPKCRVCCINKECQPPSALITSFTATPLFTALSLLLKSFQIAKLSQHRSCIPSASRSWWVLPRTNNKTSRCPALIFMNCWMSWAPTDFSLLVGIEGIQGLLGNSSFTPCTCWLQCLHFLVTSSQINLSNLLVIYCSPRCLQHAGMGFFWNWYLHLCCRFEWVDTRKMGKPWLKKVSWEWILFLVKWSISLFLQTELHSDEAGPRWSGVVSLFLKTTLSVYTWDQSCMAQWVCLPCWMWASFGSVIFPGRQRRWCISHRSH